MTACDGLSTARLDTASLTEFLLGLTDVAEPDLCVAPADRLGAIDHAHREGPYRVFCTFEPRGGDFASTFTIGIESDIARRRGLDTRRLATELATRVGTEVLCGLGDEPQPWLWTLYRPDDTRYFVHLAEDEDLTSCPCPYLHRAVVSR